MGKYLIITLDSSTRKIKNGVGPSLCFWAAYRYDPSKDTHPTTMKLPEDSRYEGAILMKALNPSPIRSGAIYNHQDTSTKIFLDGIIRALESCFYLIKKYQITKVVVLGDCKPAIELITQKKSPRAQSIIAVCNQVHKWCRDYEGSKIKIEFKHIGRKSYPLYEEIDALAKRLRSILEKEFSKKS